MELRALGRTGIRVSPIGLGTVKFGRTEGLRYPEPVRIPTDEEVGDLLREAAGLGVNLIDTAPAYGDSEERLGRLLPGPRDRWVICTKAGEEFSGGVSRFDFSPEGIISSVERSLVRLRADYLDVVLLHSDGIAETFFGCLGSFDALRRLRDAGSIRAFGASTKTVEGALHAIERGDVVMVTLNPQQADDAAVLPAAAARGVGVLVKKGLASGHLGLSPEEAVEGALRFIFSSGRVASVVVGTTRRSHLRYDVAAAERAVKESGT